MSLALRVLACAAAMAAWTAGCNPAPAPARRVAIDLRPDGSGGEAIALANGESIRYRLPDTTGCSVELARRTGSEGELVVRSTESGREGDQVLSLSGEGPFQLSFLAPERRDVTIEIRGGEAGLVLDSAEVVYRPPPTDLFWIVIDTLRADHVFDPGRPDGELPALDAFAEDAIVFPKAFSHAPMTLPAHAAMFTGRYPFQTGILCNGQWGALGASVPVLGPWLAGLGYRTSAVLSMGTVGERWHEKTLFPDFDFYDRDFRYMIPAERVNELAEPLFEQLSTHAPNFAFLHYSDPHEPYNSHGGSRAPVRVELDGELLGEVDSSEFDHRTFPLSLSRGTHEVRLSADEEFTVRALDLFFGTGEDEVELEWISGGPKRFLREAVARFEDGRWISRGARLQVWANDRVQDKEIPERYSAELRHVDRTLGRVLEHLKAIGRYDAALIVLTSDHGEELWDHGSVGHVQTLFDEVLHVPLAIKLPKGHPAKALLERRAGGLVRHVDLVPTVLELLGLPQMPGVSGTSVLAGNPELHLAETHRPEAARDQVAVRDERFKMLLFPAEDRFEMYDLELDPGEGTDVYAERGSERAGWPAILRAAANAGEGGTELSPATRRELEALGY